MLIPSIDLKAGRIVQLVQGEKLAVESTDVDGWIAKFKGFPAVQLIDLDAATPGKDLNWLEDVHMGMRVQAVWKPREEWTTSTTNILYFRAINEPDAKYESYKEHI